MTTNFQDAPRISLQVTHGVIIASIQTDLTEPVLARFRNDLLTLIHRIGARGAVFDLSGVDILDSVEFRGLRLVIKMVELLGARTVISGLKPGIISSLIDASADTDGVEATLHTDDAIELIRGFEQNVIVDNTDVGNNTDETPCDVFSDENTDVIAADET